MEFIVLRFSRKVRMHYFEILAQWANSLFWDILWGPYSLWVFIPHPLPYGGPWSCFFDLENASELSNGRTYTFFLLHTNPSALIEIALQKIRFTDPTFQIYHQQTPWQTFTFICCAQLRVEDSVAPPYLNQEILLYAWHFSCVYDLNEARLMIEKYSSLDQVWGQWLISTLSWSNFPVHIRRLYLARGLASLTNKLQVMQKLVFPYRKCYGPRFVF